MLVLATATAWAGVACDKTKSSGDSDSSSEDDDGGRKKRKKGKRGKSKSPTLSTGAHQQLSRDCDVAGHIHVARVLASGSVKKHLLAPLNQLTTQANNAELREFLVKSGLNATADVESVALCVTDLVGDEKWTVIASGDIDGTKALDAVAAVDKTTTKIAVAGRQTIAAKETFLTTAKDGSLVLSNTKAAIEAAGRALSDPTARLALPLDHDAVFVLSEETVRRKAREPTRKGNVPFKPFADSMGRATVTADLNSGRLVARLPMADAGDAAELEKLLQQVVKTFQQQAVGGRGMEGLVQEAFRAGSLTLQGNDLVFTMTISADSLDAIAKELAELLHTKL